MSTEKEINDAIAIVQEAAREGRLEAESNATGWFALSKTFFSGHYRAKPDPVERWVVVYPDGREKTYIYESDATCASIAFKARVVHLREVEE